MLIFLRDGCERESLISQYKPSTVVQGQDTGAIFFVISMQDDIKGMSLGRG